MIDEFQDENDIESYVDGLDVDQEDCASSAPDDPFKTFLESEDEVDIPSAGDTFWLAKIPKFLFETWLKNGKPNVELGKIFLKNARDGKIEEMKLTIPQEEWSEFLPREYIFRPINMNITNELVFVENSVTGEVKELYGSVEMEGSVAPVISEEYRRIMQDRNQKVYMSRRQIEVLNENKSLDSPIYSRKHDHMDSWFGSLLKKKLQCEKKERVSRADLLNLIFSAFEQYSHWSFKGLAERTKQPQTWLKEVLNDVCILKKRGPYVGKYELKPEYKMGESQVGNSACNENYTYGNKNNYANDRDA